MKIEELQPALIGLVLTAGLLLVPMSAKSAAAVCSDGKAAGYACSHVDLVAHLDPAALGAGGERLNDIWGWTDGNGEEYAIVGMSDGTAFVRLPDVFLGRLAGSDNRSEIAEAGTRGTAKSCMHDDGCDGGEASVWRDIKVHKNHAYIVSEARGFGMQVFDLTKLRNVAEAQDWTEADETAYYDRVGHSHNIFINEDSERAYIVGAGPAGSPTQGGLHVVDISDPANPQYLADINGDGYTHDVQCVMYAGPDTEFGIDDELCFASNEDTVTIWQVTDPANPEMLARFSYAGVGYVHQGWLSEDHRYFFVNDELDEVNSGSRTRLRVIDVGNVRDPKLAAEYFSPSLSIDHNNYVDDRWLLQSNYASGLRILDILDPEHPVEAAYFDTQAGDVTDFIGVWSNYKFPGSGRIVLSDVHDGLFVVKPTLQVGGIAPDLSVSVELSASSAQMDEQIEATVTLANGNAVEASEILLTMHLPRQASFATVQTPTEDWSCTASERVAECRLEEIAAGASAEFTLSLSAATGGEKALIAMAYAREADAAPADNLDSGILTVSGNNGGAASRPGGGGNAFWVLLFIASMLRVERYRREEI